LGLEWKFRYPLGLVRYSTELAPNVRDTARYDEQSRVVSLIEARSKREIEFSQINLGGNF
jgi:hypothetical protein